VLDHKEMVCNESRFNVQMDPMLYLQGIIACAKLAFLGNLLCKDAEQSKLQFPFEDCLMTDNTFQRL